MSFSTVFTTNNIYSVEDIWEESFYLEFLSLGQKKKKKLQMYENKGDDGNIMTFD